MPDYMSRGPRILDCFDIAGKRQVFTSVGTTTPAYITSIPEGVYAFWANDSVGVVVDTASVATTSTNTSFVIHAGDHHNIYIPADSVISAIALTSVTNLRIFNID